MERLRVMQNVMLVREGGDVIAVRVMIIYEFFVVIFLCE